MKVNKMNKSDKRRLRKAQIETMGLLVIVILVSIILFFVLSFNINKARTTQPVKQEFNQQQAVSNFGTTMLETTDNCGRTIRELLTDCAFTNQISCEGYDSCYTANKTISNILDLTLNDWDYKYNLTVTNEQNRVIMSIATGCNASQDSSKETTPFGTKYGWMSLTLKSCR